jgi:hypothetical protein
MRRAVCTALFLAAALAATALAQTVPATTVTYDTRACQAPLNTFPFCNTSLPLAARVADLVGRLQSAEVQRAP